MAGLETARRAIFVLDGDGVVRHAWDTDDWINPVPRAEIESAVDDLGQ
jgi:peroxiredoxin